MENLKLTLKPKLWKALGSDLLRRIKIGSGNQLMVCPGKALQAPQSVNRFPLKRKREQKTAKLFTLFCWALGTYLCLQNILVELKHRFLSFLCHYALL